MDKLNRGLLASVFVIVLIAGCDPNQDTPKTHAVEDFCGPLLEFFKTDLHLEGARIANYVDPKASLDAGGQCDIRSNSTERAAASINRARNEKPLQDKLLEEDGYTRLAGHSEDVWISDARITGPDHPKGVLDMKTRVDDWNGTLTIIDESKSLSITDEEIGHAADLLIRVTHEAST